MTTGSPRSKQSPQKNSSSPIIADEPSSLSQSKNLNNVSRPSAEDLVDLERELQKLIARKIQADSNLVKIETRLYDLETEYLTETQSFGNLIHGIEGYLGLPPATPANSSIRRGQFNNSTSSLSAISSQTSNSSINPQQRIFSSTSTTFQKSLALAGRVPEAIASGYVLPNQSEQSSDLTSINGLRSKTQAHENKKSSPTKKSAGSSLSKPPGVNKSKKSESAEWQPSSMKSSRKK